VVQEVELAMYEAWINGNFSGDCMDGSGTVVLQFDSDGNPQSATVNAPLGDRVAARINDVIGELDHEHSKDGGEAVRTVARLTHLDGVKKVCRATACMCFEGNNVIRKDVLDDGTHQFLTSENQWRQFTSFST